MPRYEYLCQTCKNVVDIVRGFNDPEVNPKCDLCEDIMKRTYGTFGIQFKGSGFYKTDNAK